MKNLLLLVILITGCSKDIAGKNNNGNECSAYFAFNQSSSQAFYYFTSVEIDEVSIATTDIVAAFKGDVCVGARQWDTVQCGGGICDLPVMGYDSFDPEGTVGYMQSGETPTFKIYDISEGVIYDATTTSEIPSYENSITAVITDPLKATISSISNCE